MSKRKKGAQAPDGTESLARSYVRIVELLPWRLGD
jgi:hypothetical protein